MEPDNDKTQTNVVLTKGTTVSHYMIIVRIRYCASQPRPEHKRNGA